MMVLLPRGLSGEAGRAATYPGRVMEKEVLDQLREIGPNLKDLARAVREAPETLAKASKEFPAAVAKETNAVGAAYQAGCLSGAGGMLVAVVLLWAVFGRRA